MPIYAVRCKEHGSQEIYCHKYESVESADCPVCGVDSPREWENGTGRIDPFTPYWTESLAPRPVYIESKNHEKYIEKKHHLQRVN